VQIQAAVPQTPAALPSPAVAHDLESELDLQEDLDGIAAPEGDAAGEPRLSSGQRRRLDSYSTAGYKLLSERLAATRELLERAPDEGYAIELFVTDNPAPARMERFLLRARDMVPLQDVFLIPMSGPGNPRLRVIYGAFENAGAAQAAQRQLPPKYQHAFRTSPRSFGELRKQM
jgi:hypothetical protein